MLDQESKIMLEQGAQDNIWEHYQNQAVGSFDLSYPRLRFLAELCPSGTKVLNIGVGSGYLEKLLVARGVEVYSLDPSRESIERLKAELSLGSDRARQGYCSNIPFEDFHFDKVVMTEVLEHIPQEKLSATLNEVRRTLKPNGEFTGTVPFREDLKSNEVICPQCQSQFHRWGHVKSYDVMSLRELLSHHGFQIKRLYPRSFPDFRRHGIMPFIKAVFRYVLGRMGEQLVGPNLYFTAVNAGDKAGVLKKEVVMYRAFKESFKSLQNGPLYSLVAWVGTVQQSIKYCSSVFISIDEDRDWHNRRRDVVFVSPELNVFSLEAIRNRVMNVWGYEYIPQPGDTVIDIGAGIGDEAVILSKLVGNQGRVIAIEAHPEIFRCLQKTIKANKLENVTPLNIAVWNQEGEVVISNEENYLGNRISNGPEGNRVKARTLDNVLKELGVSKPDLIKINIEGAEIETLQGMHQTLTETKRMVVSCHDFVAKNPEGDPSMRTFEGVKQILRNAGYSILERGDDPDEEIKYVVYGKKV